MKWNHPVPFTAFLWWYQLPSVFPFPELCVHLLGSSLRRVFAISLMVSHLLSVWCCIICLHISHNPLMGYMLYPIFHSTSSLFSSLIVTLESPMVLMLVKPCYTASLQPEVYVTTWIYCRGRHHKLFWLALKGASFVVDSPWWRGLFLCWVAVSLTGL